MTPLQVRADHTLRAEIDCGRCHRSRALRLGAIPARWQGTILPLIPFRCFECGERPVRIMVRRGWNSHAVTIWQWPEIR